MAQVVDVPYFLAFDVQTLAVSGGKASPKVVVPQNLEAFVVQAVTAIGSPASTTNYRKFLMHFESTKTGMWGNQGALADMIAGDGRNPAYFLTEIALEGGDVVTCHLENANGAVVYDTVHVVLIGRARKRA